MKINLMRSLLISLGFMVAWAILTPLGLGWMVTLAFIGAMGYLVLRLLQTTSQQREADSNVEGGGERGEAEDGPGVLDRLKGKTSRKEDERASRAQEARARAQQEADCALTHDERVKFQDIVKGLNDAG